MKEIQLLRNVEQSIIFFFVWREMMGENDWYVKGINALANEIDRQKKSVRNAIDSLQERNLISLQEKQDNNWIKLTLSDEELNSRMAFISDVFCQPQSLQELIEDLNKEIEQLEDEIRLSEELMAEKREKNKIIELVIKRVTNNDIENLAGCLVAERTYSNVNKSLEEFIKDELIMFRSEMFRKYAGADDEELVCFNLKNIRYSEVR